MPPQGPIADAPTIARWTAAIHEPDIARGLQSIYEAVAGEITTRGPACWASGRCCAFEKAGHRLYVTGLEAAYALSHADTHTHAFPSSNPHSCAMQAPIAHETTQNRADPSAHSAAASSSRVISLSQAVSSARQRGDCPFLHSNLCGIHSHKPLGCRIYFCDRSANPWQHDLSERFLRDIRDLHDTHDLPYRYAEWRDMLDAFALNTP